MSLSGEADSGPLRVGLPIVDTYSALLAAFAIQSALIQRERDPMRAGQVIDMAMLDATLVMMSSVVAPLLISGITPRRTGNRGFSLQPTADTFETAEGAITIGVVQPYQYQRLCEALDRPDLLEDPRFATPEARIAHDAALQAELGKAFATRPALEWEALLSAAGVPAGAVRDVPTALALPQLAQRGVTLNVPLPDGGATQILNAGFKFATGGPGLDAPPPRLGEHTDAMLAELGMAATRTTEPA